MYCGSTSVKLLFNNLFCLSWRWTPVQDLQVFYYSRCVLRTRQEREGIQILQTTKLLYITDNMQTQLRTHGPQSSSRHSAQYYVKQTVVMEFTRFMGLFESVCNIVVGCLNRWTTGNTNINVGDMAGSVPKSQQNYPIFWLENVATSKIFSSLMLTNAETQAWAVVTGLAVFSLLHHHRLHLLTWKSAHIQIIRTRYGFCFMCCIWHVQIFRYIW